MIRCLWIFTNLATHHESFIKYKKEIKAFSEQISIFGFDYPKKSHNEKY
jgi:hypothetical protein